MAHGPGRLLLLTVGAMVVTGAAMRWAVNDGVFTTKGDFNPRGPVKNPVRKGRPKTVEDELENFLRNR